MYFLTFKGDDISEEHYKTFGLLTAFSFFVTGFMELLIILDAKVFQELRNLFKNHCCLIKKKNKFKVTPLDMNKLKKSK